METKKVRPRAPLRPMRYEDIMSPRTTDERRWLRVKYFRAIVVLVPLVWALAWLAVSHFSTVQREPTCVSIGSAMDLGCGERR